MSFDIIDTWLLFAACAALAVVLIRSLRRLYLHFDAEHPTVEAAIVVAIARLRQGATMRKVGAIVHTDDHGWETPQLHGVKVSHRSWRRMQDVCDKVTRDRQLGRLAEVTRTEIDKMIAELERNSGTPNTVTGDSNVPD